MPYHEEIDSSIVDLSLYQELSNMGSDISRSDFVRDENGQQMCCDYASIAAENL